MSIRRRASRVICAMPSVAGVVLAPDVASAAGNGRRAPTSPVEAIKGKAIDSPVKTTVAGAECESPGRLQSWGDPVFNDGFNDASRRCSSGCLDTVGKFCTRAAEWTPSRTAFFIDGRKCHEATKKTWDSATWNKFFTADRFNIRLNVQAGSSYWGCLNRGRRQIPPNLSSTAFGPGHAGASIHA